MQEQKDANIFFLLETDTYFITLWLHAYTEHMYIFK